MNRRLRWDDMMLILAIARTGTLSGAGRELAVSHATVFRRLGDVEECLKTKLFERGKTGYAPTLAGEELAAAAHRIEIEVLQAERRVAGQDLRPSGTVRVTTTDSLLLGLLSPVFADFRRLHREISLEIAVSNELFSLSRREADVAIRPSLAPPERLLGRKIAVIEQAIYGRKDLVETSSGDLVLQALDWVGPDERMIYRALEEWMAARGLDRRCQYSVDTVFGMFAAVREGVGLAVLPCYLGDSDRQLVRLGEAIPELATDLWLLTHPDLRNMARIRAFSNFVAKGAAAYRRHLSGTR